jgi:hypothetical protein
MSTNTLHWMTGGKRLQIAVVNLQVEWGTGWRSLGGTMQKALVRAAMLAEIDRLMPGNDRSAHSAIVEEIASVAMQWKPEEDVR